MKLSKNCVKNWKKIQSKTYEIKDNWCTASSYGCPIKLNFSKFVCIHKLSVSVILTEMLLEFSESDIVE